MHPSSELLSRVTFLTGSAEIAAQLFKTPALPPFHKDIVDFLNDVSKAIMRDAQAKAYSDVVTFAFWIRRASVLGLKRRFEEKEGLCLGKGVVFHIAPSNVPVNFAYSMAAGLLMGNANVVRVPSKDFPQVEILTDALNQTLKQHENMSSYVLCVRYDHDKAVNDLFSSMADERVVWGGDRTIAELRKSPLPPRSGEVTFADRYSIAVIDADAYLAMENKARVAEDFYNDTFFSDQNACTSPRLVAWMGSRIDEAKDIFWEEEHKLAAQKYTFQPIQAVNKLTKSCLIAAKQAVNIEPRPDNLIVRVKVQEMAADLMDYRDNSGYFYEYDCKNILELLPLCDDKRCQTVSYLGDKSMLLPLIEKGVKGIDRVVPMGKTMDFDLIWDGYDLPAHLSRTIVMT